MRIIDKQHDFYDYLQDPTDRIVFDRRGSFLLTKGDSFVCLGDVGSPEYIPMIKARKKILLSHEPVYGLNWCLNIHGHDHSGIESYKDGCKHITLAANVCGYTPINLGKIIKNGVLSDIESIHRITIDKAIEKKMKKEEEKWEEMKM